MPLSARTVVRDQREPVDGVVDAAFGAHLKVSALAADLAAGGAHVASLVAVDGDQVVGHVQLSRGWVDAPDRLVDAAILSPLSVLPAWQGRGIGGDLVRAAVARAGEHGFPVLFLEGSPRYYPRFGFAPGAGHGFTAPSVRIPPLRRSRWCCCPRTSRRCAVPWSTRTRSGGGTRSGCADGVSLRTYVRSPWQAVETGWASTDPLHTDSAVGPGS